ncbi:hypothetical protein CGZ65_00535 [Neisseria weixii]|nr:hypothetical protein CGZ65_00535 [Neisseria weixii]
MKAVGTVLLPAVLMLASGGAYAEATTTGQVGTGIAIGTGTTAGTTATTATWSDSDIAIGKNATAAGGSTIRFLPIRLPSVPMQMQGTTKVQLRLVGMQRLAEEALALHQA